MDIKHRIILLIIFLLTSIFVAYVSLKNCRDYVTIITTVYSLLWIIAIKYIEKNNG